MPDMAPNVLLFGAGSIGAVHLYQFQRAGCRVAAVCRSNYEAVRQNGFTLLSERFGNVQFRPELVVRTTDECPKDAVYDFIFVARKSFPGSKPLLTDLIRPVVKPGTAIVLAQNGIAIEDEVAQAFPDNPLLSCAVYMPATETAKGVIEYPEMLNRLEIGTFPANAPASHKAAASRLAHLVISGGGQAEVHEDIQIARWQKLVLNCAWSPVCALSMCNDGDFLLTSSYAHGIVWSIMLEIISLAQKIGIPNVDEQVAEKQMAIAKRRSETGGGRPVSMLQDVQQGRLFEVEAIVGNAIRLGQQWEVKMPLTEAIYALLKGRFDAIVREQESLRTPT
ncbi:2-dehydropantoate 2-reductase [Exophiala viscosa]|uniref:2-dehydropantoate 2-reductase n=1 Tax=Exophiala viscosa TaxID=2486360 RepID=UPI002192BFFD|nr:2-dehydropantoate 2-reductase [Exophiala viscosa]